MTQGQSLATAKLPSIRGPSQALSRARPHPRGLPRVASRAAHAHGPGDLRTKRAVGPSLVRCARHALQLRNRRCLSRLVDAAPHGHRVRAGRKQRSRPLWDVRFGQRSLAAPPPRSAGAQHDRQRQREHRPDGPAMGRHDRDPSAIDHRSRDARDPRRGEIPRCPSAAAFPPPPTRSTTLRVSKW